MFEGIMHLEGGYACSDDGRVPSNPSLGSQLGCVCTPSGMTAFSAAVVM